MSGDNKSDALKSERETERHTEAEREEERDGLRVSSHRMHNGASNETGMSIYPISTAWNT